jgi:hypothetical protein
MITAHELKVTVEGFENLIIQSKTFEVRKKEIGIKYGDTITISECDEVTGEYTRRIAVAEIGITQEVGEYLIMSIDIIHYVDERGVVQYLDN